MINTAVRSQAADTTMQSVDEVLVLAANTIILAVIVKRSVEQKKIYKNIKKTKLFWIVMYP